jgi:hypothetical protein
MREVMDSDRSARTDDSGRSRGLLEQLGHGHAEFGCNFIKPRAARGPVAIHPVRDRFLVDIEATGELALVDPVRINECGNVFVDGA